MPSSCGTRRRASRGADAVILPGGFSHGDYLRTGAIARFSPVMDAVRAFAERGRPGAGHLQRLPDPARGRPAAGRDAAERGPEVPLRARAPARRADRHAVHARSARQDRCCACRSRTARATTSPIRRSSRRSKQNRQVVFRYATAAGEVTDDANPNGSVNNIAGICNAAEHRRADAAPGARLRDGARQPDGLVMFESVRAALPGRSRGPLSAGEQPIGRERLWPAATEPEPSHAPRPASSTATASSPTSTTASSRCSAASRT